MSPFLPFFLQKSVPKLRDEFSIIWVFLVVQEDFKFVTGGVDCHQSLVEPQEVRVNSSFFITLRIHAVNFRHKHRLGSLWQSLATSRQNWHCEVYKQRVRSVTIDSPSIVAQGRNNFGHQKGVHLSSNQEAFFLESYSEVVGWSKG